jgi:hypothetical protein
MRPPWGTSVADEEDALKRQTQPLARVDRVEDASRLTVALDHSPPWVRLQLVPVLLRDGEHEELSVDEETRLNQVAVDSASTSTASGLDLKCDSVLRSKGVDLISEILGPELAEEDGASNLVRLPLACLDFEPSATSDGRRTASTKPLVIPLMFRDPISPSAAAKASTTPPTQ